ncbi:MAG: hypothetical protein AMJ72_04490 [Acidithiobacillales bacterium SM1_46]|nr:MAG: hypothetical protein AMJ72_04490 [Acidithiobacillales bacterium SM1_46]
MPAWCRRDGPDLVLIVHLQPRASHDELAGIAGEALKIRIAAPPVDGKANDRLIIFLARVFDVPRSMVRLEHGASGRHKRVRVRSPRRLPPGFDWP